MSKRVEQIVEELVRNQVESLGFCLDEVELKKEGADYVLTLYIEGPNGVTLSDCEAVSRAVDPFIEEADPIDGAYFFSVSSIGLDRPLKKPRDYERNVGKEITVKLFVPFNKKKEFKGMLAAYSEGVITLVLDDGEMEINTKDIAQAKPYVDFE